MRRCAEELMYLQVSSPPPRHPFLLPLLYDPPRIIKGALSHFFPFMYLYCGKSHWNYYLTCIILCLLWIFVWIQYLTRPALVQYNLGLPCTTKAINGSLLVIAYRAQKERFPTEEVRNHDQQNTGYAWKGKVNVVKNYLLWRISIWGLYSSSWGCLTRVCSEIVENNRGDANT